MPPTKILVRQIAVAVLVALSLAVSSAARASSTTQSNSQAAPAAFANIHIDNFGKINDNYYRGAQPDDADYADLATLGIHTVIDLTAGGKSAEQGLVEHAGMKFYRIPMTTSDRPADAAVSQFLKIVNDPANQPVYVHCQGGRHRTGVMTAVYRMTQDSWTADRAYDEMKQFRFEGFPGHPTLKSFVYDYYKGMDHAQVASNHPSASDRPVAETLAAAR